MKYINSIH